MNQNLLDQTCMHFFKVTDAVTGEIACCNCGVVLLENAVDLGRENTGLKMGEHQSKRIRDSPSKMTLALENSNSKLFI